MFTCGVSDRENGASASSSFQPHSTSSTIRQGRRTIIPGLPNDLACVCLACVPLWQHGRLRTVCRAWNAALSRKFIIDLRQKLGKCEEFLCLFRDDPSLSSGEIFDPRAKAWSLFPPMPCCPYTYGLSNFECLAAGPFLFVIGGSLFDARSFPIDRPVPSSSVFRYDPVSLQWEKCCDMSSPRGSFASGVLGSSVFVAGGGSRHASFRAGGSRIAAVEKYNVEEDKWDELEGLRKIRAGCTGFFMKDEFWVMGGYGVSRTVSGVLPVDEYYSDGEVFNIRTGSWRELQPMWNEGERRRLGQVAVLNGSIQELPTIFMLDNSAIFRYDVEVNRWYRESEVPLGEGCGVIASDGEIYVISANVKRMGRHTSTTSTTTTNNTSKGSIIFQVYHPTKRSWRLITTNPPLSHSSTNPWGAMCVIKL